MPSGLCPDTLPEQSHGEYGKPIQALTPLKREPKCLQEAELFAERSEKDSVTWRPWRKRGGCLGVLTVRSSLQNQECPPFGDMGVSLLGGFYRECLLVSSCWFTMVLSPIRGDLPLNSQTKTMPKRATSKLRRPHRQPHVRRF